MSRLTRHSSGEPMSHDCKLVIGIDVGSTTVKMTVVDPDTLEIKWSKYLRHETRQAEMTKDMLAEIGAAYPDVEAKDIRCFITGSGGSPIAMHLGAKFVQEVNAVTMSVEKLHPDVGSVIELGGQDAKIIIFKANEETGDKQSQTVDERQVRQRHRRDHRQVHDQGGHASRRGCGHHLRPHQAAPCCGQVRRLRRDRHRQPGEEWHPRRRDHELAGRRHRAPEPLGAHPRQHAAPQRAAARRPEHLPAVPGRVLAPAHPADLGRARLRVPQGRADRRADLRTPENAEYYAAFGAVVFGLHEADATTSVATAASRRSSSSSTTAAGPSWASRPARAPGRGRGASSTPSARSTRPQVRRRHVRAGPGRARRHRPRRRLDLVQGRAALRNR